jgi:hypothetical protein
MIRPPFAIVSALALASLAVANPITAQTGVPPAEYANEPVRYSANQLDNLVGPIALYPDALLAQVLVAATFPDQVEAAARYVRANGTEGIDDQPWDVSVKAVAHYASAINMMEEKSDWTTTLGSAYANQSSDVMAAVQRMRALAAQHGNLVSTPQQQVVNEGTNYVIVPAQPRVIYVPVYDPIVVYSRPVFGVGFGGYWSFGVGFPIGSWLTYDCDWGLRRVYYNGWSPAFYEYGGGWRARSRPFIQITNIYVNPRYRNVYFNRDVYRRPINYRNVDRYAGVHRDVYFGRDGDRGRGDRDGNGRNDGYRGNDGNRNDGNRGNDNPRNDGNRGRQDGGYPGRTAQPRDGRPVATPDGYRNGSPDRGGSPRGEPSRQPEGRLPEGRQPEGRQRDGRSAVVIPEPRRNEPRAREMTISPEVRRAPQPRNDAPRIEQPRIEQPRIERPRSESPRNERSAQPPRQAPRQEQARQAPPQRQGEQRSAAPRGARGGSRAEGRNDRSRP